MTELTTQETTMLDKCEKIIEKGKQTFYEVGTALRTIRENRLYRKDYSTFDAYCSERWGWERNYANRLISASTVAENLVPMGTSPVSERQARELASLPAEEQREVWKQAVETAPEGKVTAAHVAQVVAEHKEEKAAEQQAKPTVPSKFNRASEEEIRTIVTRIEWAQWSWNPVTGCEHGCKYCYARDIAERFNDYGFKPTLHEERLLAPVNTQPVDGPGGQAVFVCSMADLFGSWVPNDWISKVMKQVKDNPQWTFIFLTKNPRRYSSITFPDNAWIGATVDRQERVEPTEKAMANATAKVKFVSCEPLLEQVTFNDLSIFNWVIIGGRSKTTSGPEFQPDWQWAFNLTARAKKAKCQVYWKPNLTTRPREYPEG